MQAKLITGYFFWGGGLPFDIFALANSFAPSWIRLDTVVLISERQFETLEFAQILNSSADNKDERSKNKTAANTSL